MTPRTAPPNCSRWRHSLSILLFAIALPACPNTDKGGGFVETKPVVNSVSVTPTTTSIEVGATDNLAASVSVSGGASQAITWSTSNASVARLGATSGASVVITGVSVGTATVTATSQSDGSKSASAAVTVTPASPAAITISAPAGTSVRAGGSTLALSATALDRNGVTIQNPTLTWASSNTTVASVSATGVVTGLVAGTTQITARSGVVTSNALTITVTPTVTVTAWRPAGGALTAGFWPGAPRGEVAALWASSAGRVWAVTAFGFIGRYASGSWSMVDSIPGQAGLFGIAGASENDIWAVGAGGRIRRFNGTSWSSPASPTTQQLNAAWMSGTGTGFFVGSNGTIVRAVNGVLSVQNSGVTTTLWAVWGSADNNVFAVGDGGLVLRWNGLSWARQSAVSTTNTLIGVWGRGSNYVVVVGDNGYLTTFNGSTWTVQNSGTTNALYAVAGDTLTGTVTAVGYGVALTSSTSNPGTWSMSPPPITNTAYWAVVRHDASFGTLAGFAQAGVIQRSNNGVWTVSTFSPSLNDVVLTSSTSGYAVGNYGASVQLVGATWQPSFNAGSAYIYFSHLWALSANTILATRFDGVWAFSNGSWTGTYRPGSTGWSGIGGISSTDGAATGTGISARLSSSGWTADGFLPTGVVGRAISGVAGVTIAVGFDASNTGVAFVRTSNTGGWGTMVLPTVTPLYGVHVLNATTAFAVGNGGTILRWNGSTWSAMNSGVTDNLRGVWAASPTEAYAVGAGGRILRFDGLTWTSMNSGSAVQLNAVSGIAGVMVVAVGEAMTILTGSPTALTQSVAAARLIGSGKGSSAGAERDPEPATARAERPGRGPVGSLDRRP